MIPFRRTLKRVLTPLVRTAGHGVQPPGPAQWGLRVSEGGHLCHGGVDLPALLQRRGSPLHVVLGDRLRAAAEAYQAVPPGQPAGAGIYYSYKSNPVPGVLSLLHGMGVGAEVISEYELWLALRLGVPPEQIIYNGPAKSPASLRTAVERGILLLGVNHREELPFVIAAAREAGRKPDVAIRVTTAAGWSNQFGSSIATGQALEVVREAHASGALRVRGLHSHLGRQVRTREQAVTHVRAVLAFADQVRERLGLELDLLDFGGSLACPTVTGISPLDQRLAGAFQREPVPADPGQTLAIRDYVAAVVGEVQAHAQAAGRPAPRVLLEPGRSMTAQAQLLLCSVLSVKDGPAAIPFAILDAGINLAEAMRAEYHQVFHASRMTEAPTQLVALAGPICSPGDVVRWAISLPPLRAGDTLAFMDAGAYFVPFETSFSFPRPAVVLLDGGREELLRRAETFEDLVRRDEERGA